MPTCPDCNGQGETFRFVDYRDGHGEHGYFPCDECGGTGQVSEERIKARAVGKQLRDWRVHTLHMSLRDVAPRFGLTAVELSHMEHGRIPIPDVLWEAAGFGER